MPLNPPVPGLRRIHHDANSASHVELSIAPGDVLEVSDDVAGQLLATSPQFKADAPAKAKPAPAAVPVAKKAAPKTKA